MDAIRTEGLVKKYGWFFSRRKVIAVNGLSLRVEANQIFGFLGPNGAGKTTTIKMLLGLVIPDAGTAQIFEAEPGDKAIKSRVGFLPDSPCFYNHLSGLEFIAFCGKLMHLGRMERYRRAEELMEKVGLSEARDNKLEGFSRGMLQRVGIAQALINNPDLVILDEPVSGLDPLGRREIKQLLISLRDEGRTIFFSSHILADVEEMCDEVAIMNHGKLLIKGPMDEILCSKGMRVVASGIPGDALDEIADMTKGMVKDGERWGLDVDSAEQKDAVVKFLQDKGGKVEEVVGKKETLEESFLRRIEDDEKRRKAEKGGEGS